MFIHNFSDSINAYHNSASIVSIFGKIRRKCDMQIACVDKLRQTFSVLRNGYRRITRNFYPCYPVLSYIRLYVHVYQYIKPRNLGREEANTIF